MTPASFETLLEVARTTHADTGTLQEFCAFPTDLREGRYAPFHIPAADLMTREAGWTVSHPLAQAFLAASSDAQWRETYKDTDIGDDFMARFGCYCLIGPGAPWDSDQMHAYVVYMPPGLWYPWHHHPAEELYFVLAGEGVFLRHGEPDERLRMGQASFHASNQPHALLTEDQPVMALVLWRNGFGTPPVLSAPLGDAPGAAGPA